MYWTVRHTPIRKYVETRLSRSRVRVSPHFYRAIGTGSYHFSRLDWVVFCPGDHLVVHFRWWVGLERRRLFDMNSRTAEPDQKDSSETSESATSAQGHNPPRSEILGMIIGRKTHVKQVPSPHFSLLISANNAGFSMSKACPTPIRTMTVASKIIEHLAAEGVHESDVAVECGNEIGRFVLRGDDGCYWVYKTGGFNKKKIAECEGGAYVRCSPHETRLCEGRMYGRDRRLSRT